MARLLLVLLVLGLEMPVALGVRTELRLAGMAVNPVRRVVTMLQMMQKKVAEEGKSSKEMFDKFMCQCAKSTSDLEKSIDTAQTKMPQIESSLKELIAEKDRLTNEIGSAKATGPTPRRLSRRRRASASRRRRPSRRSPWSRRQTSRPWAWPSRPCGRVLALASCRPPRRRS